jgi:hypothetical protein
VCVVRSEWLKDLNASLTALEPFLKNFKENRRFPYVQYDSFAPLQSLIAHVEKDLKERKLNLNSLLALDGWFLRLAFGSVLSEELSSIPGADFLDASCFSSSSSLLFFSCVCLFVCLFFLSSFVFLLFLLLLSLSALNLAIRDNVSKVETFDEKAHATMKQLLAGNVRARMIPGPLYKYRIVHRASNSLGFPSFAGPSTLSLVAYARAFPDRVSEAQKLNPK